MKSVFFRFFYITVLSFLAVTAFGGSIVRPAPPPAPHAGRPDGDFAWGKAVAGYQVGALVSKRDFAGGESVLVHVRVRNLTDRTLPLPSRYPPEEDFPFVVTEDSGEAVPLTRFGRSIRPPLSDSAMATPLNPHQEQDFVLDAGWVYDMTMSGDYRITVQRSVWLNDRGTLLAVASSGPVKVTVMVGGTPTGTG